MHGDMFYKSCHCKVKTQPQISRFLDAYEIRQMVKSAMHGLPMGLPQSYNWMMGNFTGNPYIGW